MFTKAEIVVLLWFVPVALNIILPLAVLGGWLITRLFRQTRPDST